MINFCYKTHLYKNINMNGELKSKKGFFGRKNRKTSKKYGNWMSQWKPNITQIKENDLKIIEGVVSVMSRRKHSKLLNIYYQIVSSITRYWKEEEFNKNPMCFQYWSWDNIINWKMAHNRSPRKNFIWQNSWQ